MAKFDELKALIEPVVTGLGFVFWGLEYEARGKHSLLRVFIDHEDGIDVDQCAEVSHQISAVMDVEDPIKSNYTLEVSSPGMDRPLFTLDQFALYPGEWVDVRLRAPFEGRRKFKGVLTAIEDQDLCIQVDDTDYLLPVESIEKANLIPNFDKKETN